jgi:hypothetical protein
MKGSLTGNFSIRQDLISRCPPELDSRLQVTVSPPEQEFSRILALADLKKFNLGAPAGGAPKRNFSPLRIEADHVPLKKTFNRTNRAPVLLLLFRLAGADEEKCIRIFFCIGVNIMQQNNIRSSALFLRRIDFNFAADNKFSPSFPTFFPHFFIKDPKP